MKKFTCLIISSICFQLAVNSQTFQWLQATTYSTSTSGDWVGSDKQGNVYVAGTAWNSNHGHFGSRSSAFLSKYSSTGELIWTDTLSGVIDIYCDIDEGGNIYAVGMFMGKANFGNKTLYNYSNKYNGYLVKYNSEGNCTYSRSLSFLSPKQIKINPAGGYLVTGGGPFEQSSIILDNISFNNWGFFLADFNESNICQWAVQSDGTNYSWGNNIAIDNAGNAYVGGKFWDAVTIYATSSSVHLQGAKDNDFLCKFDKDGKLLWSKRYKINGLGTSSTKIKSICLHENGIYLLAYGLDFISDDIQIQNFIGFAIINYNEAGELQWHKLTQTEHLFKLKYYQNNLYLAGSFSGEMNFESQTIYDETNQVVIGKFDKDYNLIWVKHTVGMGSHWRSNAGATSLFVDEKNIYLTGSVSSKVAFDNLIYDSDEYPDMFVTKLTDDLMPNNIIEDKETGSFLNIYPNPSHSSFTLHYSSEKSGVIKYKVSTITGAVVYEAKEFKESGIFNRQINLDKNPPGIYFVELTAEGERLVKKLILVK
jgi:hypothetical protein